MSTNRELSQKKKKEWEITQHKCKEILFSKFLKPCL